MLTSIALILILGLMVGRFFDMLHFPRLFGMILTGIMIGPHVLNLLDDHILTISAEIRQMALIVILTRAGLTLDINDLKKVGRPAILMCFVPACFEIVGMVLLAPRLLGFNLIDSLVLGSVIAAVSPAVVVPKMLYLMDNGYGKKHSIPQLILAGASVDDVFVIVLFSSFCDLSQGGSLDYLTFLQIPVSIILGIIGGYIIGTVFSKIIKSIHIRKDVIIFVALSTSFLIMTLQDNIPVPFSGLLAIMASGLAMQKGMPEYVADLSRQYAKLWNCGEVLLFVLVGSIVDIEYAFQAGILVIVLLLGVLVFRMVGVLVCLIKTKLTKQERIFCMLAYTPKATVQAAIGGVPLALGLSRGNDILTVAVVAILLTAPLGAFMIDMTHKKLLDHSL